MRCTSLSGRKAAFEERNDGKVEREAKFTEYKREIDKREKERQAASGTKKKKPNKFSVCSAALQLTPLLGKQTGNRKRLAWLNRKGKGERRVPQHPGWITGLWWSQLDTFKRGYSPYGSKYSQPHNQPERGERSSVLRWTKG